MYELKIVTNFAAAHQLKMVAKQCENLHGHNWQVEVFIKGEKLNAAGVLLDFGELKQHVNQVVDPLDHRFLNELAMFDDETPPSSENIAYYIAVELEALLNNEHVQVSRVTTWESGNACATYIPPA